MTSSRGPEPVEERLADRLRTWHAHAQPSRAERLLRRLGRLDRGAYRAVAETSMPRLDGPLRRVSDFANFSKPWFLVAGVLALFGGRQGRRAAMTGVAAIGVTSFVVNQPMSWRASAAARTVDSWAFPRTDGCGCRRRPRSPPATQHRRRRSPSRSGTRCPDSDNRCGWPPRLWRSLAFTPASTTPATSSRVRRSAPWSDGRPRRWLGGCVLIPHCCGQVRAADRANPPSKPIFQRFKAKPEPLPLARNGTPS